MPQTTPIKQLVENEVKFYPLTAANGVFFSDGTFLSSKTFISSATYNSTSKKIEFYEGSTKKFELDATAFIKDGMVSSATISNGNLVITFNTDAGTSPITIPLTDIFNANNYYTKTETDATFVSKSDYESDEEVISIALNDLYNTTTQLSNDLSDRNDFTDEEKAKLAGIAAGAEVNVQANWNETNSSSDAFIQNKPTIPTVNNGTLTIQKNGTTVDSFTANSASNVTVDITVPTKTSDLTNDSGFLGESEERVISAALNDLNSRINSSDSTKEDKSNKVTSIDSSSTDTEYPSAKAVYDYALNNDDGEVISTALNDLNLRVSGNTSDIDSIQTVLDNINEPPNTYYLDNHDYYSSSGEVWMTSYPNWSNIQNKPTIRTSIRAASSASDTDLVSEKAISTALASAGQVDNVTLNGVSATISNKTAALPLSVSSTGSGNVVTSVSLGNNSTTINVTKGNVDTSGLESTSNKLTSGDIASYSTNTTKYPSAKVVYDYSEAKTNKVTSLSASSTDTQYPSAKAVYDALETKLGEEDEEVISAALNDLNTRLEDVEDMVVFDTVPTGNSGNLVTSGAVYQAIATMTAKKQLITHTASETNVTDLAWDTVHKFPEMTDLSFTVAALPNDGYTHEITIIFDSGATSTNLTYPTDVLWGRNVILVPQANYRYEISIDSSMIAVFTEASLPTE